MLRRLLTQRATFSLVHSPYQVFPAAIRKGILIHRTSRANQSLRYELTLAKHLGHLYIRFLKATSDQSIHYSSLKTLESMQCPPSSCPFPPIWSCRPHLESGYNIQLRIFIQIFCLQLSTSIPLWTCSLSSGSTFFILCLFLNSSFLLKLFVLMVWLDVWLDILFNFSFACCLSNNSLALKTAAHSLYPFWALWTPYPSIRVETQKLTRLDGKVSYVMWHLMTFGKVSLKHLSAW